MPIIVNLTLPHDITKRVEDADFIQGFDNGDKSGQDYFNGRSSFVIVKNKNSSDIDSQNLRSSVLTFGFEVFNTNFSVKLPIDFIEELWLSNDTNFSSDRSLKFINVGFNTTALNRIIINKAQFGIGATTANYSTVAVTDLTSPYGQKDLEGLYEIVNWPFSGRGGLTKVYMKAKIKTSPISLPEWPELYNGITTGIGTQEVWYPSNTQGEFDSIVWLNDMVSRPSRPAPHLTSDVSQLGITTSWTGKRVTWGFNASEESAVGHNTSGISRYISDIIEIRPLNGSYLKIGKAYGLTERFTTLIPTLTGSSNYPPSGDATPITVEQRAFYPGIGSFSSILGMGVSSVAYDISGITSGGITLSQQFINFTETQDYAPDYVAQVNFTPTLYAPNDLYTVKLAVMNGVNTSYLNDMEQMSVEMNFSEISNPTAVIRQIGVGVSTSQYQIIELPLAAVPAILQGGTLELYLSTKNTFNNYMFSEAYFTPNGYNNLNSDFYGKSYWLGSGIHSSFTPDITNQFTFGAVVSAWTNNTAIGATSYFMCNEVISGLGRFLLNSDIGDCNKNDNTTHSFSVIYSPGSTGTWNTSIGKFLDWQFVGDGPFPNTGSSSLNFSVSQLTGINSNRQATAELISNIPSFSNRTKVTVHITHTSGDFYIAFTPAPPFPLDVNNTNLIGITSTGIGIATNSDAMTVASRCDNFIDLPKGVPTVMIVLSASKQLIQLIHRKNDGILQKKNIGTYQASDTTFFVEINNLPFDKTSNATILDVNGTKIVLDSYLPTANKGFGFYTAIGVRADNPNDFNGGGNTSVLSLLSAIVDALKPSNDITEINLPHERFYSKYTSGSRIVKNILGQHLISGKTDFNGYLNRTTDIISDLFIYDINNGTIPIQAYTYYEVAPPPSFTISYALDILIIKDYYKYHSLLQPGAILVHPNLQPNTTVILNPNYGYELQSWIRISPQAIIPIQGYDFDVNNPYTTVYIANNTNISVPIIPSIYAFKIKTDIIGQFVTNIYPRLLEIKIINDLKSFDTHFVPKIKFYNVDPSTGYIGTPIFTPQGFYVGATTSTVDSFRQYTGDSISNNDLIQFELNTIGIGSTFMVGSATTLWAVVEIPPASSLATAYTDFPLHKTNLTNYISNPNFENGNLNGWNAVGTGISIGISTNPIINNKYSCDIIVGAGNSILGIGTTDGLIQQGTNFQTSFIIDNTDQGNTLLLQASVAGMGTFNPEYIRASIFTGTGQSLLFTDLSNIYDSNKQIIQTTIGIGVSTDPNYNNLTLYFGLTGVGTTAGNFEFLIDDIIFGSAVVICNDIWYKLYSNYKQRHDNIYNGAFVQTRVKADSHAPFDFNAYVDYNMKQRFFSQPSPLSEEVRVDIVAPGVGARPKITIIPPIDGRRNHLVQIQATDGESGPFAFRIIKEIKQGQIYTESWLPWQLFAITSDTAEYEVYIPNKSSSGTNTVYENIGPRKVWAQVVDKVGNVSESLPGLVIQEAWFKIDTKPPTGSIGFVDKATSSALLSTNQQSVLLKVNGQDQGTAVKDFRWRKLLQSGNDNWSPWRNADSFSPYVFNDIDGRQRIEVQLRDYANNINTISTQFDIIFDGLNRDVLFIDSVEFQGDLYLSGIKMQHYTHFNLENSFDPNFAQLSAYIVHDPTSGQTIALRQSDRVLLTVQLNGIGTVYQFTQFTPIDPANPTTGSPVNSFYLDNINGYVVFTSPRNSNDIFDVVDIERNIAVIYKWDKTTIKKVADLTYLNETIITSMIALDNKILIGTGNGNIYPFDGRVVHSSIMTIIENGVNLPISKMITHKFESESDEYLYIATSHQPIIWQIPISQLDVNTGWKKLTNIDTYINTVSLEATRITDILSAFDTLFISTDTNIIVKYNKTSSFGVITESLSNSKLYNSEIKEDETNKYSVSNLHFAYNQVLAGIKEKPETYIYTQITEYQPSKPGDYIRIDFDSQFKKDASAWQYYDSSSVTTSITNIFNNSFVSVGSSSDITEPTEQFEFISFTGQNGFIESLTLDDNLWGPALTNSMADIWTLELNVQNQNSGINTGRQSIQISDGRYFLDLTYALNKLKLQSGNNILEADISLNSGIQIDGQLINWIFDGTYGSPGHGGSVTQGWSIDEQIASLNVSNNQLILTLNNNQNNPRIKWNARSDGDAFKVFSDTTITIDLSINTFYSFTNGKIRFAFSDSTSTNWDNANWIELSLPPTAGIFTFTPGWSGTIRAIAFEFALNDRSNPPTGTDTININNILIQNPVKYFNNLKAQFVPLRITVNNKDVQLFFGRNNTPIISSKNFLQMPTTDKIIKFGKLYIYKNEIDILEPLNTTSSGIVVPNYEPGSMWNYAKLQFKMDVVELPLNTIIKDFELQWRYNSFGGVNKYVTHQNQLYALTNGNFDRKLEDMSTPPYELNYASIQDAISKIYIYDPSTEVWMEQSPNYTIRNNTLFVFKPLLVASYKDTLIISGQYINLLTNSNYFENLYFITSYYEDKYYK